MTACSEIRNVGLCSFFVADLSQFKVLAAAPKYVSRNCRSREFAAPRAVSRGKAIPFEVGHSNLKRSDIAGNCISFCRNRTALGTATAAGL